MKDFFDFSENKILIDLTYVVSCPWKMFQIAFNEKQN